MKWTVLFCTLLLGPTLTLTAVDYPIRYNSRKHDENPRPDRKEEATPTERSRHQDSWLPDVLGSFDLGGNSGGMDWNIRSVFGGSTRWWKGPNVCESRKETEDHPQGVGSAHGADIATHHFYTSSSCDETPSAYKCTTSVNLWGKKRTLTVLLECCHGFQRAKGQPGCPVVLNLQPMEESLAAVGAQEMSKALKSTGLNALIDNGNFTVFAPKDEAFKRVIGGAQVPSQDEVLVVSPEMRSAAAQFQQTLMAHVAPGILKTSAFSDELLVPTVNPDAFVRINLYDTPKHLLTANCVPVTSADHMVENGVVHVLEKVLPTAKDNIVDIISKNSQLSILKTMLGRLGLAQSLRTPGQLTLFAPSNGAFDKIKPTLLNKLLYGDACLGNLVKSHLLPNVICSSIIEGKAKTRNVLGRYLNLTRDDAGKLWLGHAQIIQRDIMASNGVVHIVDDVIVPEDVLDILEVARKVGATDFAELVRKARLTKEFETSENVTLFLPTNQAIQSLPDAERQRLEKDPASLAKVLHYHVIPGVVRGHDIRHNAVISTRLDGKSITVKEYFSAPFGLRREKTTQCGRLAHPDIETCNGVVHIIDKLLIPPKGDVLDTISQLPNMTTLVRLLKVAGVSEGLQGSGPFTFLAPTDQAWAALGPKSSVLDKLTANTERLKRLLLHHITTGTICCAGVFPSNWAFKQRERMLDRSMVSFKKDGRGQVYVGHDTLITGCDITASNGVVHVIDDVIPDALRKYVQGAESRNPDENGNGYWWNRKPSLPDWRRLWTDRRRIGQGFADGFSTRWSSIANHMRGIHERMRKLDWNDLRNYWG